MKMCAVRKKRDLCTLLLILCCGSCRSLNQNDETLTEKEDLRCIRKSFFQLLESPPTDVCCKYGTVNQQHYDACNVAAAATVAAAAAADARHHSEMNSNCVLKNDEIHTHVAGSSESNEEVVSPAESSLGAVKHQQTYPIKLARNGSEVHDDATLDDQNSADFAQYKEKPNELENSENLVGKSGDEERQHETENATATTLLNDSIIPDKEAMPSFDEWKKIRLEQEMMQGPSKQSAKEPETRESVPRSSERKRGRRNYASIECGAKLVSANPGAQGASKVLVEAKDEYMLNPCSSLQSSGMWFMVELCETIHPTHIELANFELYSSTGKQFVVYMSDHYQSREWTPIARYEMAHLKTVQSFPLDAPGFGKVIKVEFLSIYENSQYYCPLSLVRVFGTSMVDDYEDTQLTPESRKDAVEPTPVATSVTVDENMVSRAKQAMFNIIDSVSKAVSGTRTLAANCSGCLPNESSVEIALFGQQFDNCFESSPNLSRREAHLWPSMKCRFAQVARLQRSCRPSPLAQSIAIEPSSLSVLSNVSPPAVRLAPLTSAPSITRTADMISPTSIAEAEQQQHEIKTIAPMNSAAGADSGQSQPSLSSAAESLEVNPNPVATVRPNARISPLSHLNPLSSPQPTPAPNKASTNQNANQAMKENLFSRFENRIKKLELHMNLSGTYLEELSKRYRDEMEEMQAAFNQTVAALNMEAKKGLERDQNQQQALAVLQEKLTAATESLRRLQIESDSLWWRLLLVYLGLLVVSIALFIVLFHLILRRSLTTYVWSEHIERRVTEVIERERRLHLDAAQAFGQRDSGLALLKPSENSEQNLPVSGVKQEFSESQLLEAKPKPKGVQQLELLAVKQEPLDDDDDNDDSFKQQKLEPLQIISQNRKRRRKRHNEKEGFSGVSSPVPAHSRPLVYINPSQPIIKLARSL